MEHSDGRVATNVAGVIQITGGAGSSGTAGQGGHLISTAGAGTGGTGGSISLVTGAGTATSTAITNHFGDDIVYMCASKDDTKTIRNENGFRYVGCTLIVY